jgi:hypothetical protein
VIGEDGLPLALDPEAFGDGAIDLLDLLPEADELFLDDEVDATPAFDGAQRSIPLARLTGRIRMYGTRNAIRIS